MRGDIGQIGRVGGGTIRPGPRCHAQLGGGLHALLGVHRRPRLAGRRQRGGDLVGRGLDRRGLGVGEQRVELLFHRGDRRREVAAVERGLGRVPPAGRRRRAGGQGRHLRRFRRRLGQQRHRRGEFGLSSAGLGGIDQFGADALDVLGYRRLGQLRQCRVHRGRLAGELILRRHQRLHRRAARRHLVQQFRAVGVVVRRLLRLGRRHRFRLRLPHRLDDRRDRQAPGHFQLAHPEPHLGDHQRRGVAPGIVRRRGRVGTAGLDLLAGIDRALQLPRRHHRLGVGCLLVQSGDFGIDCGARDMALQGRHRRLGLLQPRRRGDVEIGVVHQDGGEIAPLGGQRLRLLHRRQPRRPGRASRHLGLAGRDILGRQLRQPRREVRPVRQAIRLGGRDVAGRLALVVDHRRHRRGIDAAGVGDRLHIGACRRHAAKQSQRGFEIPRRRLGFRRVDLARLYLRLVGADGWVGDGGDRRRRRRQRRRVLLREAGDPLGGDTGRLHRGQQVGAALAVAGTEPSDRRGQRGGFQSRLLRRRRGRQPRHPRLGRGQRRLVQGVALGRHARVDDPLARPGDRRLGVGRLARRQRRRRVVDIGLHERDFRADRHRLGVTRERREQLLHVGECAGGVLLGLLLRLVIRRPGGLLGRGELADFDRLGHQFAQHRRPPGVVPGHSAGLRGVEIAGPQPRHVGGQRRIGQLGQRRLRRRELRAVGDDRRRRRRHLGEQIAGPGEITRRHQRVPGADPLGLQPCLVARHRRRRHRRHRGHRRRTLGRHLHQRRQTRPGSQDARHRRVELPCPRLGFPLVESRGLDRRERRHDARQRPGRGGNAIAGLPRQVPRIGEVAKLPEKVARVRGRRRRAVEQQHRPVIVASRRLGLARIDVFGLELRDLFTDALDRVRAPARPLGLGRGLAGDQVGLGVLGDLEPGLVAALAQFHHVEPLGGLGKLRHRAVIVRGRGGGERLGRLDAFGIDAADFAAGEIGGDGGDPRHDDGKLGLILGLPFDRGGRRPWRLRRFRRAARFAGGFAATRQRVRAARDRLGRRVRRHRRHGRAHGAQINAEYRGDPVVLGVGGCHIVSGGSKDVPGSGAGDPAHQIAPEPRTGERAFASPNLGCWCVGGER